MSYTDRGTKRKEDSLSVHTRSVIFPISTNVMGINGSMLSLILPAALLAMAAVSLVFSAQMYMRRQSTPGPQKSRQIARIALGPMIVGTLIILAMGQLRPEKRMVSYLLCPILIVPTLRFAWMILHQPTEADAIANFAHDGKNCGRCGYSVTGNVTGLCSECGWTFPTHQLRTEDADWSVWWRKWRIDYLHHYLWSLTSYIGIGLYCLLLAAIFWSQDHTPQAVVVALLGIHLCINALRVIVYLLRRKREVVGSL